MAPGRGYALGQLQRGQTDEGEGSSGDVYEFGHRPAQPEALSVVSTILPSCSLGFSLESSRTDGWWETWGQVDDCAPSRHEGPALSQALTGLSSPGTVGKMRSPNLPHFPPQIPPQSSVVPSLPPPLIPGPREMEQGKGSYL